MEIILEFDDETPKELIHNIIDQLNKVNYKYLIDIRIED